MVESQLRHVWRGAQPIAEDEIRIGIDRLEEGWNV